MNNFSQIKTYDELISLIKESKISYDLDLIERAYLFSEDCYKDLIRKSGDTYLQHAIAVAGYTVELNLDSISVATALLHDTVEKAKIDINIIDKKFGTDIAFIVDGLTSIQKLIKSVNSNQVDVENFKHLIINATEDIRILIIRILEKYHNLQSVNNLDPEIIKSSALKALNIYAPLAEYLGLAYIQRNIEDLAFKILYPNDFNLVNEGIKKHFLFSQNLIDKFLVELANLFKEYKVSYLSVSSRQKGVYSSYKKAKRKLIEGKSLEEEDIAKLKDIHAARIILNSIENCYLALGLIHSKWEYIKEEFDDYISRPKLNGYRSLQTAIIYENIFFEVQIRTEEMHEYNEFGPASHIAYKLKNNNNVTSQSLTWTKDLVKWQSPTNLSKEDFKISAFAKSIFVFTPKGLIIRLEKDSSPLDFAFQVHTHIGYRYVGAKVNGKMVNMSCILKTGDVIEILTSNKFNVTADWVKFAKMTETKSRIRRHFNTV